MRDLRAVVNEHSVLPEKRGFLRDWEDPNPGGVDLEFENGPGNEMESIANRLGYHKPTKLIDGNLHGSMVTHMASGGKIPTPAPPTERLAERVGDCVNPLHETQIVERFHRSPEPVNIEL